MFRRVIYDNGANKQGQRNVNILPPGPDPPRVAASDPLLRWAANLCLSSRARRVEHSRSGTAGRQATAARSCDGIRPWHLPPSGKGAG
jgi:hypothetical protein